MRRPGIPCIVATDSNALLGSRTSELVGPAGVKPENFCGSQFHKFLDAQRLVAANTWPDLAGPGRLDPPFLTVSPKNSGRRNMLGLSILARRGLDDPWGG